MKHIEEDAELYAVGALSEVEARAVEAHIAQCALCAQRVAQAADLISRMETEDDLLEPPADLRARVMAIPAQRPRPARRAQPWLAVAAALLIGLAIPTAYFTHRAPTPVVANQDALDALIQSHFLHTMFAQTPATSPAKLVYARDGKWIYVLVHHPMHELRVRGYDRNGRPQWLGTLPAGERNASLFVRLTRPVQRVQLLNGPTPEGSAVLTH